MRAPLPARLAGVLLLVSPCRPLVAPAVRHAAPLRAQLKLPAVYAAGRSAPDIAYSEIVAKTQRRRRTKIRTRQALRTLRNVALPTAFATVFGFLYFDNLSLFIRSTLDVGTIRLLMADEAQFIQNFLTVIGLLFSILAGNAYSALYAQQEAIYVALFQEVSEAKSLLEQTTLVCQGRPFYPSALRAIREYVKNDLRRLDVPPAQLLSSRPMEDPLEAIMYMTSVGVPSVVYETVKNLRQARGMRLGAMQRKFPTLGIALLYLLAGVELLAFPLLGAGTANSIGILSLQSFLFAMLCGAHMLVLRIIQELWQSSGGVFNVDEVLQQMVYGLEEELELRSKGRFASQKGPMAGGPDNDWVPSPMQWAAAAAEGVADTQAAQTRWKPSWDKDDDDDGDGAAGAGGEATAVDRAPLPTMALDSAAVYELPLQPSVTMPVVNNDDDGDGADGGAAHDSQAVEEHNGAVEEGVGRGNPLPPLPRPQRALLGRAKGALEKAARSIL